MTTLARGISATATILDVSDESLNVARPFLATLDSETVRVRGLEYVSGVATRWNVDRGIDSTPATHAGGATVTLGDAAGPGGVAEPGTLVAEPPETAPDLVAALGAANAPDGANPLATLDDIATQVVTRTLTSAEILALFTTPIELVAGQPGKVIRPVSADFIYRHATTLYTTGTDRLVIGQLFGSELGFAFLSVSTTVLTSVGVDEWSSGVGEAESGYFDLSLMAGTGLYIAAQTADPTDGDGLLEVTVLYQLVDVPLVRSTLAFVQQPTDVVADAVITPAVTVRVLDSEGALYTLTETLIAVGVTDDAWPLLGTTSKVTVDGVATFDDLRIDEVGTYTLDAFMGAYEATFTSTAFDVTP